MQNGIIVFNGVPYGGGGGSSEDHVFTTQEEYDALPETKLTDDKIYFVDEAGAAPDFTEAAENVFYRNITGQPDNVQDMLELLSTKSKFQVQKGSLTIATSSKDVKVINITFPEEFENVPTIFVTAGTGYETFGYAEASFRRNEVTTTGFTGLLQPKTWTASAEWKFNWLAIAETTAEATSLEKLSDHLVSFTMKDVRVHRFYTQVVVETNPTNGANHFNFQYPDSIPGADEILFSYFCGATVDLDMTQIISVSPWGINAKYNGPNGFTAITGLRQTMYAYVNIVYVSKEEISFSYNGINEWMDITADCTWIGDTSINDSQPIYSKFMRYNPVDGHVIGAFYVYGSVQNQTVVAKLPDYIPTEWIGQCGIGVENTNVPIFPRYDANHNIVSSHTQPASTGNNVLYMIDFFAKLPTKTAITNPEPTEKISIDALLSRSEEELYVGDGWYVKSFEYQLTTPNQWVAFASAPDDADISTFRIDYGRSSVTMTGNFEVAIDSANGSGSLIRLNRNTGTIQGYVTPEAFQNGINPIFNVVCLYKKQT